MDFRHTYETILFQFVFVVVTLLLVNVMEFGSLRSRSSVPNTSRSDTHQEDDEEALKWAALERLPTYTRARRGLLHGVAGDFREIDLDKLEFQDKRDLVDRVIRSVDENELFLKKLKKRIDRVSLHLPTIEVRFQNLKIDGEAYVGSRALPSVLNYFLDVIEGIGNRLHIHFSETKKISILRDVSGIIKPGRMALLLGPPGSGKSTLLQALAGKHDSKLEFSGLVTYNGHTMREFVPGKTASYISQYDVHLPQLTVRETLSFSARCQGVGTGYDMLTELLRREKQLNITPDPYLDALMKASVLNGQKEDIVTAYILKILGLEVCADSIIGNEMRRGISGGQRKRVTTGEMLVGPVNVLFMDNISTGLDSSTTFQIVNSIRQSVHIFKKSALISLLQPPPETFKLFDDVVLLSEGQIVYQGPREYILPFFESMGFICPERKGVADYLQEVTSRKDQRQYWAIKDRPYHYVSANVFAEAFNSFHVGQAIQRELAIPYDRSTSHPAALTKSKYGAKKIVLLKACLEREWTLVRRNSFLFVFKILQLEICALVVATVYEQIRNHHDKLSDGNLYMGALFTGLNTVTFSGFFELPMTIDKLPVFYKQRDHLFYPAWAFSLPGSILGIPLSIVEVALWVATTYYIIGFDSDVQRFFRQYLVLTASGMMSYSLFRCLAALTRDHSVSNTAGCIVFMAIMILGGFVLSKDSAPSWLIWAYWLSPFMYSLNAVSVNEFLGESWDRVVGESKETLGISFLKMRRMFVGIKWYWIGFIALIGFLVFFNLVTVLALTYLDQYGKSQVTFIPEEVSEDNQNERKERSDDGESLTSEGLDTADKNGRRILLPFIPFSLTFDDMTYSVDMPKAMKDQGVLEDRLVLLKGVSGAFRPGVLTALMGVSGAGKTTLLDVLAGRKNSGYIEGNITVSGFPKNQETFARISGYCEQNDIHSPFVTVFESLVFSAWLRLPAEVEPSTKMLFAEEVMELVELTAIKDALVGYPNLNGLSVEQRKRLTIAVELVANPSIMFLDEPTSGLDARAAAVVMRAVRNTVDTGRTVVCTIHQPSIDIFESFNELILLTRGGEEIYVGPLGPQSRDVINYFERINGVTRMRDDSNPATWVMEITTRAQEELLGINFADVYKNSDLYRRNKALIAELSKPPPGSQDLHFPSKYSQPFRVQLATCLWKHHISYWRNTTYNGVRLLFTTVLSIVFGILFWKTGSKRSTMQEIMDAMGSMFMATNFVGSQCSSSVRPVVISERIVFYRERAAGLYSALPYAIAQLVIELPYTIIQSFIYGVIVYAMMGFEWTAAKFLLYFYFMFMTLLFYIYYGMAILAVSPTQEMSAVINGVIFPTFSIFAGFSIPRKKIAAWWRWYYWLCPPAYGLYGLATSQYGDVQIKLDTGETVAEFMNSYFGYRYDFLWVAALALMAFVLAYAAAFAYAMRVLNFQRR